MAAENDDRLKAVYTNELFKHYLGTHLDTSAHAQILARAKNIVSKEQPESHSADNAPSDY